MLARAPKWLTLAPNDTNTGLFQIRFQYILARRAKMYWNLICKRSEKATDLSHLGPIWPTLETNLTSPFLLFVGSRKHHNAQGMSAWFLNTTSLSPNVKNSTYLGLVITAVISIIVRLKHEIRLFRHFPKLQNMQNRLWIAPINFTF